MENQMAPMAYQQLGNSTLMISKIGFGCMSLKAGQTNIQSIIGSAIDKGINYFDTADIYDKGINETNLGQAIKQKRKQLILATKVGNVWKPDGSGLDWDPTKAHIIKAVEESLVRLQTDYIDLYQLHGGTIEDNIDDTIEAFETLLQQGKIRYYGISSVRPNVIRAYVERSNIVSVMMQYSLLDRRPEETCLPLLQQHNIGVLARGSIAGGLLAGKAIKPYLNYTAAEVLAAAKAIKDVETGITDTPSMAIKFVLANTAITAAIIGIRTMEQITDAVNAIGGPLVTGMQTELLKQAVASIYYEQHR